MAIRIRMVLLVFVAAFAVALSAPAAHAQYNNTPTLTVDNPNVTVCQVVMITGTNFPPNASIPVSVDGVVVGNATTDGTGTFTFPWNTCGASVGSHTVTASVPGASVLSVVVNVQAPGTTTIPTTTLPVTGSSSTLGLARLGAGLVAFGAIVVLIARRRLQAQAA